MIAPTNTCYLYYNAGNNSIVLASDQGNWMTPVLLGTKTTPENSQCSVNAAASSATGAVSVLTVNVSLTFKSKLAGANGVYLWAGNSQ